MIRTIHALGIAAALFASPTAESHGADENQRYAKPVVISEFDDEELIAVPLDSDVIRTARSVGISFGD